MNYLVPLFILIHFCSLGQKKSRKIIKSGESYSNTKDYYYFENDKKGNRIFMKNEGMNGKVSMIFSMEYDTLNREVRCFSAHSNIGYSIDETVYGSGEIKYYSNSYHSKDSFPFNREFLKRLNSQKDFMQLAIFRRLSSKKKHHYKTAILDSMNNVLIEYSFSEEGDTTSVNMYEYNKKNQETHFHFGTIGSENWTWDIYYLYDQHSNRVQSLRVESQEGIKDTTEVYNYIYNTQNQLITDDYYNKKIFQYKTDYSYNLAGQVIEERFYENDELNPKVVTNYQYNKNGEIHRKTSIDYRNSKEEQKETLTYKLNYW